MTGQASSFGGITPALRGGAMSCDPIATRARVRRGSALLLLSVTAVLAGCAPDEGLSLGEHRAAPPSEPVFMDGTAGGAALDTGSQAPPDDPPPPHPSGSSGEPFPRPAEPLPPRDASIPEPSVDADAATQVVACAAGTYVADLWCAVDPSTLPPDAPARASSPMRATMSFTVEQAQAPQQLEIRGGTLMFQYMGSAFLGRLEGGLDCASSAFHADIVDGSYTAQFPGGPVPRQFQFQGSLDGMLDRSAPMLAGSWWHGPADRDVPEGAPRPSCNGTWTAQLQEP